MNCSRFAVVPALAVAGLLFTRATAGALPQVGVDAGTEAEVDRSGLDGSVEGNADAGVTVGHRHLDTEVGGSGSLGLG
ncbi:hypothetical protein [Nocardia carnea]|uniref:hypothetical protein n=1 Tax=Nocardia carnea TaxID=37328 RepID=UPI002453D45E|nr:hypothetical protein [Nocardia carnea]